MISMKTLLLASQSPRRGELLRQINIDFETLAVDVDEAPKMGEAPADYVLRLALAKARVGCAQSNQTLPSLGADTAVVIDYKIFGKPRDRAHAVEMLGMLSARTHNVLTAVALVDSQGETTKLVTSNVRFRKLNSAEIADYWESGEPQGKAGAYAIQGFGATFVEHLEGSYSGVMGLPLFETAALLRDAGVFGS